MAAQKKNTSSSKRGSSKSKKAGTGNDEGLDLGFGLVLGGWFLFAVGVILLLGCISSVYSGTNGNWLGPYMGKLLPNAVTLLFGKVAVLFFTVSLILWGLGLAFSGFRGRLIRYALGLSLLSLDISFLLSLKNYGVAQVSKDVLKMNGGVLGQFFSQNIAIPIFGTASCIAPLCLLLLALVLILVLAFGLRPRHFAFVVQGTQWMKNAFRKKEPLEGEVIDVTETQTNIPLKRGKGAKAADSRVADPALELPRGAYMDDNTVMLEPEEFKIRRKGKVVPFSGRNNWLDNGLSVDNVPGVPTMADGAANAANAAAAPIASAAAKSNQEQPAEATANVAGEYNMDDDPEIRRLEEFLRVNGRNMNALEIVEVKERIAALRRARDLIAWEKDRKGKMQVKGEVRRDDVAEKPTVEKPVVEPAAENTVVAESAPAEERTIVAGAASSAVADETVAAGSVDATVAAGYDSQDDETMAPVIYGADSDSESKADASYDSSDAESSYESSDDAVDYDNGTFGGTIDSAGLGESATGKAATIPQPDPTEVYDEYKVPKIQDILDSHEAQTADYTEEELNEIGKMLEEKLENFKVKGRVIGCETGPMITRFEVEPGPGVKVSRFTALQEDLAMPLKVSSVRILAPIPGKAAVGIEIPNRKFQTVFSKDVFESDKFNPSPEKIVVALGKDITGEAFSMDLAKAPHLLIAGQTGSGKSVCINALMASMLFSKTPDELRMILVDPKAVELKMYESIPHLLAPVITKPEIAIQALQWLCYEMDRRTEVLATAKVRNIGGFNAKYEAGELPDDIPDEDKGHRMPFIVVIIDEMADLMMVAGKEIEKSVARLAAKARAVGIHLVLATQRPSVKVITGIIKANLPTRISFKVASQIDARTVMDHAGAEKLLGRGDMLFKAVNDPDPVRVHGAFLSDEEAEKLADACSNQNVFYPQVESFDVSEGVDGEDEDGDGGKKLGKLDPLLFDVACWAIEVSGLSTSAVQRHFSVGYSRAGKIVDQLYGLKICGPSKGNSKPRAMLVSMDELMQLERSGAFR